MELFFKSEPYKQTYHHYDEDTYKHIKLTRRPLFKSELKIGNRAERFFIFTLMRDFSKTRQGCRKIVKHFIHNFPVALYVGASVLLGKFSALVKPDIREL